MKKAKIISISALLACVGTFSSKATLLNAEEGLVATSTIEAWKFAGRYGVDSSYCAEGVQAIIPGSNTVGQDAWQYSLKINNDSQISPSFSLKNNEVVSIDFSIVLFDSEGNTISKSNNTDAIDIYVCDASNDAQIAMLRIWASSGGGLNDSHSYAVFGNDWNAINGSTWIKGRATEDSSFHLQFDKENLFSSFVGGSDALTRLDDSNNTLLNNRKNAVANIDEIYFKIQGDNGFTNETKVVVKSINGQSLANENGNFKDTTAPKFKESSVAQTLTTGEEYTIPTEAFDLFGDVTYSIEYANEVISGKTFTPIIGYPTAKLVATDLAGNKNEVEYTFSLVSNIEAPVITSLPIIANQNVTLFQELVFDRPEFNDSTGTATTTLIVKKGEDEVARINESEDHKFRLTADTSITTGEYSLVYEITNSGGTTTSDPIVVTLTAETIHDASFVTSASSKVIDDLSETGVRVRTDESWATTSFGTFDISYGLDVKFIVPETATNGNKVSEGSCLNLKLINADDPNLQVMYRVWIKNSGPDAPTNVYISTDGGKNFKDITDTGWISRTVDEVNNKYHMTYSTEDTFSGERTGGMTRVDNAYDDLVAFFNQAPSSKFEVAFVMGYLAAPTGTFEYVITEINGQKFESTNGTINTVNNPFVKVEGINDVVALNETLNIRTYAKDIISNTTKKLIVTKPNGESETIEIENENVTYSFTEIGTYTLKVEVVGTNGQKVEHEREVICKSSTTEVSLTVPEYQNQYDLNSEIKIEKATYSENVVTKSIVVTNPDGSTVEVQEDSKFKFTKPGIYKITYAAFDDAKPNPNKKEETITINVPDTEIPVVVVTVSESLKVNESIKPSISITEDSEYDVTVTIEKPDSSVETLKSSNNYEYSFAVEGTYTLKVVVEDIYGNSETVRKVITVSKVEEKPSEDVSTPNEKDDTTPSKKGCKGQAAGGIISLIALAGIAIKRKRK